MLLSYEQNESYAQIFVTGEYAMSVALMKVKGNSIDLFFFSSTEKLSFLSVW